MYAFIYAFLYQLGVRKRHSISEGKDNGWLGLLIASTIHFGVITVFIELIFDVDILYFLPKGNKYELIPIVIVQSILVYYWCKKRGEAYVNKYKDTNLLTFKNSLMIILLYLIPFVAMILFQKNSYYSI